MTNARIGKRLLAGVMLAVLAAPAAWAAPGQNVTSTSGFTTSSTTQYLSKHTSFGYSLIDQVYKDSIGGVECAAGACAGAYLSWAIGANIGAFANASISNTVQSAYIGTTNTTIGSALPGPVKVGDAFLLVNQDVISDGVQSFGKGQITANVGANFFIGGELLGDACLGVCLNPNDGDRIYSLGVGSSKTLNIFSYDSAANAVTFMGNSVSGVLPKDFQADGLPISAHVAAPDLSGATGFGGNFTTQQEIGGVYLDVAQVVANAFGIPGEAISGSFLGFDYVTLSAKLGLAIDLVQNVTTSVKTVTKYLFSEPVQFQRIGEAGYSNPTTSFSMSQGEAALVKAGDATSLGVLTETSVFGTIETSLALNAVIKAPIKILEITGNGLDLGPVFETSFSIPLGNLTSFTDSAVFFTGDTLGKPITFTFLSDLPDPVPAAAPGFVFQPLTEAPDISGISEGAFFKVFNLGAPDCNEIVQLSCLFDTSVAPKFTQQRITLDGDGQRVFSYSNDFTTAERVAAAPRGVYGAQSSPEQLNRRLNILPLVDYQLASLPSNVPEPGTWLMFIAGFGLVGAAARHGRRLRSAAQIVSQAAPAPPRGRSAAAARPFRGHAAAR